MKHYCGPYWAPKWIRKVLSTKFNASCKIHDLDYDSKKFSRSEADIRFLVHMIRQSRGRFSLEVIACILFLFVRIGGKISWHNADQ